MNYILNADKYLYYNLEDFVEALESGLTEDTYYLLFAYPIEALFEKIKRRAALRGKLAKDNQGNSQLDSFQLTEDERDIFIDFLQEGSAKIFKEISGFSKRISGAFRFNVPFGDPLFSSLITTDNGTTIIDTSIEDMEVNVYAGMKMVIINPGLMENKERTIVSNTADTFIIESAFDGDTSGLEYVVAAQTEKYILIYSMFDIEKFDTNVMLGIDAIFEKTFIGTVLKDWYKINRFMEDFQVEAADLKESISDLRMHYFQSMKPYRAEPFFNDDDSGTRTNP
jgi:hypothetical protein